MFGLFFSTLTSLPNVLVLVAIFRQGSFYLLALVNLLAVHLGVAISTALGLGGYAFIFGLHNG